MCPQVFGTKHMLRVEDAQIVFRIDGAVGSGSAAPAKGAKTDGRTAGCLVDDGADAKSVARADMDRAVAFSHGAA